MTKAELLAQLAKTREGIRHNTAQLEADLDVGTRMRKNISQNPYVWLGAALFLGYILSGRKSAPKPKKLTAPRRGKKQSTEPDESALAEPARKLTSLSLLLAAVRFVLPFVRPALNAYLAKTIAHLATRYGR